ncbi:hypothetical protein BN1723_018574 [Verticillium longisporum]|uniref:Uncharacterized protein n=1 Tax=Verticillium longisporum TaxID=100787 RepID=A0A0G4MLQ7_VERLO|nr:hypothetical protein BN1723_018574 [Verticillium longisporum]
MDRWQHLELQHTLYERQRHIDPQDAARLRQGLWLAERSRSHLATGVSLHATLVRERARSGARRLRNAGLACRSCSCRQDFWR